MNLSTSVPIGTTVGRISSKTNSGKILNKGEKVTIRTRTALPTGIEGGQDKFKFDSRAYLEHIRHNYRQKGFFRQNGKKMLQKAKIK